MRPRQGPCDVLEKQDRDLKLLARQRDMFAAAVGALFPEVEQELPVFERGGRRHARAAQQRRNPCDENFRRSGLDQIVVGAGIERVDNVLGRRSRGHEEDRQVCMAVAANPSQHVLTRHVAHAPFEDHQIPAFPAHRAGQVPPCAEKMAAMAGACQNVAGELKLCGIVVEDGNTHELPLNQNWPVIWKPSVMRAVSKRAGL
ncbi:protein of unknown function (plasmid) [Paraburkholderia kururiensis]